MCFFACIFFPACRTAPIGPGLPHIRSHSLKYVLIGDRLFGFRSQSPNPPTETGTCTVTSKSRPHFLPSPLPPPRSQPSLSALFPPFAECVVASSPTQIHAQTTFSPTFLHILFNILSNRFFSSFARIPHLNFQRKVHGAKSQANHPSSPSLLPPCIPPPWCHPLSGSQFFFCLQPMHHLDGKNVVFGERAISPPPLPETPAGVSFCRSYAPFSKDATRLCTNSHPVYQTENPREIKPLSFLHPLFSTVGIDAKGGRHRNARVSPGRCPIFSLTQSQAGLSGASRS